MLLELANNFSVEITNAMKEITPIMGDLVPDFASDIFGKFLTLIAPVWNPLWIAFSEILEVLVGF